ALGKTRTSMIIILWTLPINVLFNHVFIFGKFGVPAFGGIGSGIATAITYWVSCLIAIYIILRTPLSSLYAIVKWWTKPIFSHCIEQLNIVIPIGMSLFLEPSIFSAVTLFLSVYSTYTIAAPQAAIDLASLLSEVPLSVGMGLRIAG